MGKYTLGVVAIGMAAGCATGGWAVAEARPPAVDPQPPPPAGKAKVCVVRPGGANNSVHPIRDNGSLVGATNASSHFCYLIDVGNHQIKIEANPTEQMTLTAEAGKSYYLREDMDDVMGVVVCKPSWVEEPDAKRAIEQTTYRVIVTAPAGEALPSPSVAVSATK